MIRHFLSELDFSKLEAAQCLELAQRIKKERKSYQPVLSGESWGMIFYKNSTRTRVSFEVGLHELGSHPLFMSASQTQLGRGETPEDTIRVLSRYLHGVVVRCYEHKLLEDFAQYGSIPIINALSDFLHPCQTYTDAFSMAEKFATPGQSLAESLKGKTVAFLGDTSCNMANSWILTGLQFDMNIRLGGPESLAPKKEIKDYLAKIGQSNSYVFTTDAAEAVSGADVVYTDVWVSMGDESEAEKRLRILQPYQVNKELFEKAKRDALFMHCLPAHQGEEVSEDVLNHKNSIIFDEAENRLHTQKAIIAMLASFREKC